MPIATADQHIVPSVISRRFPGFGPAGWTLESGESGQ